MAESAWAPLRDERESALELLDAAIADARAAGRPEEAEGIESHRTAIQDGAVEGGLWRGLDGRAWGMAVWEALEGPGRRVAPIYLAKDLQDPAGWTKFLSSLLDSPDPAGPVLLFNSALPGFDESDARTFLAPRGFFPFHRYGLAYPPGHPLPGESPRPVPGGRLRTLSAADLEPLAALNAASYARSIDRFLFGDGGEPLAAARSLLRSMFDGRFGAFVSEASFGWELDGTIQGATLVTRRPSYTLLADVAVHPSVQGRGHARRLIRATIEALGPEIERPLVLSVTRESEGAFRLYRDLGFVVQQGPFTFWADPTALGVSAPALPLDATAPTVH